MLCLDLRQNWIFHYIGPLKYSYNLDIFTISIKKHISTNPTTVDVRHIS